MISWASNDMVASATMRKLRLSAQLLLFKRNDLIVRPELTHLSQKSAGKHLDLIAETRQSSDAIGRGRDSDPPRRPGISPSARVPSRPLCKPREGGSLLCLTIVAARR
jgi:hypothetical protein